jgi:branched-chain amino acid transport system substrate-binding protein
VLLLLTGSLISQTSPAQFLTRDRPLAKDEIRIGMSNAESGRYGGVGTAVKQGCEAYFAQVNRRGGVHGRQLKLVAYDDRYEPLNTIVNTERLINRDRVFALLGYVGSATSDAVLRMIREANIALVGPIAGDPRLHDSSQTLVFVTRANFRQQAETVISHLTSDLGITRIGVFRQDDAFGESGREAVAASLRRRGLGMFGEGSYIRNSVDIEAALDQIIPAKPEAVLLIGTYQPCAAFVLEMRKRGLTNLIFASLSSIGTDRLVRLLGPKAEGLVIPEAVPPPDDRSNPLVRGFQDDLRAFGSEDFSYAGLEGYLNALVLVSALDKAGADLTEENFLAALRNTNLQFGPLQIRFPPPRAAEASAVLPEPGDSAKAKDDESSTAGAQPAKPDPKTSQTVADGNAAKEGASPVFLIQVQQGKAKPVETLSRPPRTKL